MTKVVSAMVTAAKSKLPTVLPSLDISAAFDTLDQNHLLLRANKLFGFDGVIIDWLCSYLWARAV